LISAALIMAPGSAFAKWNGVFYRCAKTSIADVSHLTITEGAKALGLDTLGYAVEKAGLGEFLDSQRGTTVFAPMDEAFERIDKRVLEAIVGGPGENEVLTAVLTYHVSAKETDPRRVLYARKINTLSGQTFFLKRGSSEPKANQSNVECQDYRTANGLVWVIDSALLPQF